MVLLQHKLSVKLSQRQILTPGLVQMVSVLALNKLELKDMINSEMVENPVLEELEESVPLLDEVGKKEEDRERAATAATRKKIRSPRLRRKIRSKKSISARFSRTISIPATARTARWKRSSARRSRISSPSRQSYRSSDLATGRAEPAAGSARGRRSDRRQPERRRIPDRQRRRIAGSRAAGFARSRRRRPPRISSVRRRRWDWLRASRTPDTEADAEAMHLRSDGFGDLLTADFAARESAVA